MPSQQQSGLAKSDLAGKVALVTGANRGIGRAIARHLADLGAQVMLTARDQEKLDDAARGIREAGGDADVVSLDLREADAGGQIVAAAVTRFGRLDIVVNNAGATRRGPFLELTEADFADGFALKFFGTVRVIRAAWPHVRQGGSVVNIAGIGGRTPGAEFTIGGSVNAALLSLTKALADQGIVDGVQVNAINPGAVRTERLLGRLQKLAQAEEISEQEAAQRMIRSSNVTRFGEPEDIAHLVGFVVGPHGQFLHGALIDADGGATKSL